MTMTTPRDASSRIRSATCRVPSLSPDYESEFAEYFDWQKYYAAGADGVTQDYLASSSPVASPSSLASPLGLAAASAGDHLSPIITEIPTMLQHLHLNAPQRTSSSMTLNSSLGHHHDPSMSPSANTGSPPGLEDASSSTSPSENSSFEHREDHAHTPASSASTASLKDAQSKDDHWTYQSLTPKVAMASYPRQIQIGPSADSMMARARIQAPAAVYPSTATLKRRRPEHDADKRHRALRDAAKTADVRKSGACVPCRVSKTRCQDHGVCPTCRKAFPSHAHLACIRVAPTALWPLLSKTEDIWSPSADEEKDLARGSRFFVGKPCQIGIFLTNDIKAEPLTVTVQAYTIEKHSKDAYINPQHVGFTNDCVPSHRKLRRWVEEQVGRSSGTALKHVLPNFLMAYTHEGAGMPRHELVSKIHEMSCFFTIWKTPQFWCRDPSKKITTLPLSLQAQIRSIAFKALKSLELDVLKLLDDVLAQQETMQAQERLALWAALWQFILIYRELVLGFRRYLTELESNPAQDPTEVADQQSYYKWLGDNFFPLITVFYRFQFRMKRNLELPSDWLKASCYPAHARKSKTLHRLTKAVFDARTDFYAGIKDSKHDIDKLLYLLAVEHDLKKLNSRSRPAKNPKKGKHGTSYSDED